MGNGPEGEGPKQGETGWLGAAQPLVSAPFESLGEARARAGLCPKELTRAWGVMKDMVASRGFPHTCAFLVCAAQRGCLPLILVHVGEGVASGSAITSLGRDSLLGCDQRILGFVTLSCLPLEFKNLPETRPAFYSSKPQRLPGGASLWGDR